MKKSLLYALAFAGVAACGTTLAAPLVAWNIYDPAGPNPCGSPCTFQMDGSVTFWSGNAVGVGEPLTVRAYQTMNSDGTGKLVNATVRIWGAGLGVEGPSDSGIPNHSTDNNGKDDVLVFAFDDASYRPTSFQIGWSDSSNPTPDIRTWIGGSGPINFNAACVRTLAAGDCAGGTLLPFWSKDFQNVGLGPASNLFNSPEGQYLLLAGDFAAGTPGDPYDYFKVMRVSGTSVVPEPATLSLGAFVLVLVAVACRRGRHRGS